MRKSKILSAIVENYIATGEALGSKSLLSFLDFSVSSATVRNEMAELSEMGYLEQPHTSAGRIPSQKAYRYYVDNVMENIIISPREQKAIEDTLRKSADDPEHILTSASEILAQLTGYVAISTTPPTDKTTIERIRLVQTGNHTAMMVLITSTGMVKNRLFRSDYNITADVMAVFERALNEMLTDVLLSAITPAFIQTVAVALGDLMILMPQVLLAVADAAKEASVINLCLNGQTNLLLISEFDLISVRGIMRFLSNSLNIENLLFSVPDKTTVLLGGESKISEIQNTSIAVSRYQIQGSPAGSIAVMGPTRMDYARILAHLEYISHLSGKLISELLE
ncbi:MAG TPA: heat-inducible transcription repressor HrcA [Clostridiales bacterium]|nr:heat-inducible transcription repressor HrcA [Clostridiales bacterium]